MGFLTTEDYKSKIDQADLENFTNNDPEALVLAEQAAQEEICSYLRSRYDMEATFRAEGTDRNNKIVEIMVDLSVWNLIPAGTYRDVSDIRELRFNAAIKWLLRVQEGKLSPDLPKYPEESGKGRPFRWGSEARRSHLY